MTLLAIYSSPATATASAWAEDVTSTIRLGSISGLAGEAELGAVGQGNVVLDDISGTVGHLSDGIVGLKQFYFNEMSAPVGNRRLWTGYVADRRYQRGQGDSLITTVARKIDVTLVDLNSLLSFRVFAPVATDPTSSFVRPAESALARIAALLAVDFVSTTLFDIGYVPITGGVNLDANDYTGARPVDVLNDIAQATGWNFFVLFDEASGKYVLWMDNWKTDGTTTKVYDSALRLTNVVGEDDQNVTFAVEPNAVATLDPSRVVSAVYLPYNGGTAYRKLAATADTFAWRDTVAPSVSVKSLAKANALADRYLLDNSTEDERIKCTVRLPAAKVTGIHEGMRLQVHFTHLPNVQAGFTWTRVLQRTIRQDVETEAFYWLDLELSPIPPQCPSATPAITVPPNLSATSADGGYLFYGKPGIIGPSVPTPGFVGAWNFPQYNVGGIDYAGDCVANSMMFMAIGDGTWVIPTLPGRLGERHPISAYWEQFGGSGWAIVQTQLGNAGDTFTFNVTTQGQTRCNNRIKIIDDVAHPCGGTIWGYGGGATWTPAP